MKFLLRFFASLAIMAFCFAFGVFIVRNGHEVTVDYVFGAARMPLYVFAAGAALAGLLFCMAFHALGLREAEDEVHSGTEEKDL